MRDVVRLWLPTILYVILLLVLGFSPSPKLPAFRNSDKFVHAAAYAVLGILACHAAIRSGLSRPFLLTIMLAFAVGSADEGIQALGRRRTADRYDLMADIAGAAVGALITRRFLRPESCKDRDPASCL